MAAAVAYTWVILWGRAAPPPAPYSYDVYNAHLPNAVYAARALARGFGLLWIGVQNCGQPFLPATLVGPFYPPDWLLLLWRDPTPAFLVCAAFHLAVGGVATYGLCRAVGVGRAGALAGALTFQFSASSISIAIWVPTSILGPYVWMPAAWWGLERLLDRPDLRRAAALAVVLALQALGGYPQVVLFTYEVMGLRLLVGLVPGPWTARRRRLAWAIVALGLPVALAAVYLFPAAEFARLSVRGKQLSSTEFAPTPTTWQLFTLDAGAFVFQWVPAFTLVGCVLAAATPVARRTPRGLFYLAICLLYLALPWDTPLLRLYRHLPLAGSFREPIRFIWVSTAAFAVAVACGLDAILRAPDGPAARRPLLAATAGAGLAAFMNLVRRRLPLWEEIVGWSAGAAIALALASRRGARIAAVALPVLVGWNAIGFARHPFSLFARDDAMYRARAGVFDLLRERMTPQDRFLAVAVHADYGNVEKSATYFDLPSIDDYEPQTSERFAELSVYLFLKRPMDSFNTYYYRGVRVPVARQLLDLLATRYVTWDPATKTPIESVEGLRLLDRRDGIDVYENPRALPRAFFVPRLEVVPDGLPMLERLDDAHHDPRAVAFVTEAPPDGFLGEPGAATGTARIVADRSERLTVQVEASGGGFLFVSDQLYPGWAATVNDVDTPIVRANYAFRAVRVPAGSSTVEMRYRPRSLVAGAAVSLLSAVGLAVAVARDRRSSAAG